MTSPAMPAYHTTTTVDGEVIGTFRRPIPDPFARTTITLDPRDVAKAAAEGRGIVVEVTVGADLPTLRAVMHLNAVGLPPEPEDDGEPRPMTVGGCAP